MKTQVSINIPIWMILGIGVFVFIIMLLRNYNKDKEISKKIQKTSDEENLDNEESSLNWIEKKDLLYWIIIICLGTISIFTFKYKTADEVIDHWGFAGTIVSIILAVLAIIYTYYQSATTVDSTKRLERSAKKVQKATTRVEEVTKELESNNVKKVISELEKNIQSIILEMKNDFKQDLHSKFSKFSGLNLEDNSMDNKLELDGIDWKGYLEKNILNNNLTMEGMVFIYFYYLFINDILFSMDGTKKFLKNMNYLDEELENGSHVILGEARIFRSLNIMNYELGSNDGVKFTWFNESVEEEMKSIFNDESLLEVKSNLDKTFK